LLAFALCGCRGHDAVPYTQWVQSQPTYQPAIGSGNAFDVYASAAQLAESIAGDKLYRVDFDASMKAKLDKQLAPALSKVFAATSRSCRFEFQPTGPFDTKPYRSGWRLLGRAIVWRIEAAISTGDWSRAVTWTIAATRFGSDLSGGDAADATLGYGIADEARRVLAPRIPEIPARDLERLSGGIQLALKNSPPIRQTLDNEGKSMLASVQYVQDVYREKRFVELNDKLQKGVRQGIEYLEKMKDSERPRYFDGFAAEAQKEITELIGRADLPRDERKPMPDPRAEYRPWKRLAGHFLRTGRPLLDVRDQFLARTRLFVLCSKIQAIAQTTKLAPANLSAFPKEIRTDPFSGKNFIYRSSSMDFKLYSVGRDGRDDGGETDEVGVDPDLVLEEAAN
jgi:hypothetical protein